MEHCGQLIRQSSSSCCSTIGLLLIYAQMLLRLFRWSSIGEWEALPSSGSATTMTAILARVLIQSFQGKPPTYVYVGWSTVIYTYLYHWPCVSPSTLGRAITERRDTGIQLDLFSFNFLTLWSVFHVFLIKSMCRMYQGTWETLLNAKHHSIKLINDQKLNSRGFW